MVGISPRLLQLREYANGIALHHMQRARAIGFRHMLLSLDDPADSSSEGIEKPVVCVVHGINADVQRQWASSRFRQDPLWRMKSRGEFAAHGSQPLLWENHQGRVTLSTGRASITATEHQTMRWVYDYGGARTGVNVRPCELNGRQVSISFYSDKPRDRIEHLDDTIAILFYLSHMIAQDLRKSLMHETASDAVRLTPRETECLRWVAAGKNAQETAVILGLSVQTVRDHLKRVRGKLNSTTRAQALMRAMSLGLLPTHQ
jgi:DNA-binding CsgD family transcriptional regulator